MGNDNIFLANDNILLANDNIFLANDNILLANDNILLANDNILLASYNILLANDNIPLANDHIRFEQADLQPYINSDLLESLVLLAAYRIGMFCATYIEIKILNKMKIIILAFCLSHCFIYGFSQDVKQNESNALLKELAENGCKCVDSINAFNKPKETLSKEIGKCIDIQTSAYQLGSKLMTVKELEKNAKVVDGKKQIDIIINTNEDSREYKSYYFELERYMLAHCNSLKVKMAANGDQSEKSMSTDPQALKYYDQAIEESKKQNYKNAVLLYEKAVGADPAFVNAWDNLGICYRRLKEYDKSIYAYKKSLENKPDGLMPLQNLAIVYRHKDDYLNAIKAYEKLALVDIKNPEVYFGLGQVYAMNLHEYEKGLNNMCIAYNLYIVQKSPYRTDAETIINRIYDEMKKLGQESKFNEILKLNNISIK